ncbi:MAG TPA: thioredoxin domain-containing protein [Actinomycetota bacterium]|nr:thioredoxin domain-containing protein [Actinomycetota bacterium]
MPNRLAGATSPYLLQHADNPVDWYEWSEEAFQRAREQDRPVLLSVGYAACHWCHVMERESFEDPDIARLMNEHFVCIKVDREERPDVDAIYMDAVQAMSGQGGWPMTVFLTPDGRPFFAGTYFPPEDRRGMPGFPRVLEAIAGAWRERREELVGQGQRVVEAIGRAPGSSSDLLTDGVLREALAGLRTAFDEEWGGFGGAPKFPQPITLELLLRWHRRGWDTLDMVTRTLDRMAAGGIHDHVGGGFHRYAVDRTWLVPHFEKMLYDNAQLASTFLHGWQVTGRDRYRDVTRTTLDFVLRELRHPDGPLLSSLDADSEGQEGRFYVWAWDELVAEVGEEVAEALGAGPEGNWEGRNVLWRPSNEADLPEEALRKLLDGRSRRVRPATDDKVLAGWNGLAISALAAAGRVLDEPRYVEAATAAAGFVLSGLRSDDGRLLRSWRDGRTSGPAYLDDHALVAAACLDLYETTFEVRWFEEARRLADDILRLFADPQGGFFQTGEDAERLVLRPKELFDTAVPSGSSAAADVLLRLSLLTGEAELERAAVSALRRVHELMARAPTALAQALGALDRYVGPSKEVAVVGDPDDPATGALLEEVRRRYLPNVVVAAAGPNDTEAAKAVPLLEAREPVDGRPAAYVCERFVCQRPVTEPEELAAQLA